MNAITKTRSRVTEFPRIYGARLARNNDWQSQSAGDGPAWNRVSNPWPVLPSPSSQTIESRSCLDSYFLSDSPNLVVAARSTCFSLERSTTSIPGPGPSVSNENRFPRESLNSSYGNLQKALITCTTFRSSLSKPSIPKTQKLGSSNSL